MSEKPFDGTIEYAALHLSRGSGKGRNRQNQSQENSQQARFSKALREAELEEMRHPESVSMADVKAHLAEISKAIRGEQ